MPRCGCVAVLVRVVIHVYKRTLWPHMQVAKPSRKAGAMESCHFQGVPSRRGSAGPMPCHVMYVLSCVSIIMLCAATAGES
jgi:hypothetical protein